MPGGLGLEQRHWVPPSASVSSTQPQPVPPELSDSLPEQANASGKQSPAATSVFANISISIAQSRLRGRPRSQSSQLCYKPAP